MQHKKVSQIEKNITVTLISIRYKQKVENVLIQTSLKISYVVKKNKKGKNHYDSAEK